jgi:hypothetical protein
MVFFLIPIIVVAILAFGVYSSWVAINAISAIIQILSIVIVIIIAPFLVKFIADIILYTGLKLDKYVALILGMLGSIPILLVLYANIGTLIVFAIIIGIIYVIGGVGIGKMTGVKSLLSIRSWFKGRK